MAIAQAIGFLLLGYLIGSVPFGLIWVKLLTGKDIRNVESGRTGGTNALRAAGLGAGILTAISDIFKGTFAVWVAQYFTDIHLVHILAAVGAILGHNYSLFLVERDENRKLRFRGGAGGAPCVGGAIGLWSPAILVILPIAIIVFFTLGYASITTLSIAVSAIIVFSVRAYLGLGQWVDALYGVISLVLLAWSLRPNILKLMNGTERVVNVSLHGYLRKKKEQGSAEEVAKEIE